MPLTAAFPSPTPLSPLFTMGLPAPPAADLVCAKSPGQFSLPSLFFRSRKYAVSPPALLLARSGGRSVEGIALSKQSAQDMVRMIRYESLDIFVSKKRKTQKCPFSIAVVFRSPDYSVELCKINTFAHYFYHAVTFVFKFYGLDQTVWTEVCCLLCGLVGGDPGSQSTGLCS